MLDDESGHFSRLLPSSKVVIAVSLILYLLFVLWVVWAIDGLNLRLSQAFSALIISTSAFAGGNTYRLKDIRRREGYKIGQIDVNSEERRAAWMSTVPPSTLAYRFKISIVGVAFAAIAQVFIAYMFLKNDMMEVALVSTFLVMVLAGLMYLGGTFTRPID